LDSDATVGLDFDLDFDFDFDFAFGVDLSFEASRLRSFGLCVSQLSSCFLTYR